MRLPPAVAFLGIMAAGPCPLRMLRRGQAAKDICQLSADRPACQGKGGNRAPNRPGCFLQALDRGVERRYRCGQVMHLRFQRPDGAVYVVQVAHDSNPASQASMNLWGTWAEP